MIYFGRALQDHVLRLFDDSLAPLGLLGLGRKETLSGSAVEDRFDAVVPEERLFRRRT
jgi:chemotaxis protein methyltransferase CheR